MSEKYKLKNLNKLGDCDDNFKDWKNNNILTFFEIPFEPELQQSSLQFLKSDLVVDLCEIFKTHIRARIIRIFSDVIQLSKDFEISTLEGDSIILIVARRVEIKPGCKIIVNNEKKFSFKLVIYTMDMPTGLNVSMKSSNIIKLFKVNSQYIGGSLSLHKGEFINIKIFDTKILQKEPFNKILQFSLQIACALFYDEPEVARSIFTWIDKITKHSQSKEAKELYHHGLTMLEQYKLLNERKETKNQRSFVPLLDKKQFYKRIRKFMKTAESYKKSYTKVLNNKNNNKMEIEKLESMLSNCNYLTKSHEIFEKEENGRFKSATEILETTKNILEKSKDEIKSRRLEFSEEIEVWKDKMKSETKKELVIAIIEMSLCVGMIIIQPHGIIDLIETAKKVSDLINIKINNMVLCDVYSIIQITKKIKEIGKLGNGINRSETYMAIDSEIIESMNVDLLVKILETDDQKGILMNAEWKIIRRQMEKLLEFPINQKIKGAKEYLNSLTNFFTYIDAYIKAKIDVVECKRECSRIRLQVETFKMKEAQLKKLIKRSENPN
ncbi:hypothetical protein F8M41_020350 [Gigaspora margarita]|uniref:Uncharacterized protein n=1 Tax=Gigaspora margarita TaxID=4874 RepID=A0A8H4AIL9_GIGMA|nr:hypothetical protein F8M41_020350 [Gigaspora margarita]